MPAASIAAACFETVAGLLKPPRWLWSFGGTTVSHGIQGKKKDWSSAGRARRCPPWFGLLKKARCADVLVCHGDGEPQELFRAVPVYLSRHTGRPVQCLLYILPSGQAVDLSACPHSICVRFRDDGSLIRLRAERERGWWGSIRLNRLWLTYIGVPVETPGEPTRDEFDDLA